MVSKTKILYHILVDKTYDQKAYLSSTTKLIAPIYFSRRKLYKMHIENLLAEQILG